MINEQRKLIEEMRENQSYQDFKTNVEDGIKEKDRYDDLKKQEKTCNDEIKKFNEMLKQNNENYASEAQQSQEDTIKLRKTLNETMTESELQVQYQSRVIKGQLACLQRKYKMKEQKIAD